MFKTVSKRAFKARFLLLHSLMLILCLFQAAELKAQDKIITNDDKIIVGYNLEIGKNAVFYTDSEDANSDLHRVSISDIMIIKKADGSVINPANDNKEAVSANQSNQTDNLNIVLSKDAKLKNQEYLEKINAKFEFLEDADLKRDKKTKIGILQYGISENSIVNTDELKLKFVLDMDRLEGLTWGTTIHLHGENTSDQIIYVDLGNSFCNGKCVYVPTATQVSSTTTGGGSINLGGVANALGVGGALGAIAGGINVGGSKGNTVSEIQYAQRVIAIPPHSSAKLFTYNPFSKDTGRVTGSFVIRLVAIKIDEPKNFQGKIKDYEYNENLSSKLYVTYYKSEDLTGPSGKMSAEIYPSRLLYVPVKEKGFKELIKNTPENSDNRLWYWTENIGKEK